MMKSVVIKIGRCTLTTNRRDHIQLFSRLSRAWKASRTLVGSVALVVIALSVSTARADLIDISIGDPNAALAGFTGPYANLNIDLIDSTHANITFTSLINGGYTYLMGDGGTADLNVNGTYTLGGVTLSNSIAGFNTPTFVNNTPGNVDGFGVFNLSLNLFDGFTRAATSISFGLTDTSGTWASASNVLTANSKGAEAAVHAFACLNPCTATEGAAVSGFAKDSATTSVPEPASLALTGLGLLGIRFMRRKRAA